MVSITLDAEHEFADESFQCEGLFSPPAEGEGWEMLLDNPGSLQIWRKRIPETSVYEYKTIGIATAPSAEVWVKVAFMDLEYHKQWDVNCIDIEPIKVEDAVTGVEWVYWEVKYPWPMSNRDYVYARKHLVKDGIHYIRSRAKAHPLKPEEKSKVRVELYRCNAAVRGAGNGRCEYGSIAVDDPKVLLPSSIVNYFIAKTLPAAMASMEIACGKYEEWKLAHLQKSG
jgi:hypothetical protein